MQGLPFEVRIATNQDETTATASRNRGVEFDFRQVGLYCIYIRCCNKCNCAKMIAKKIYYILQLPC